MKLKIAYFGSPDFSSFLLEKIITSKNIPLEIKLIITQPDRPVGRKQIITSTPVKQIGEKYKIPVQTDIKAFPILKVKQIDLAILFAYGRILPENLLNIPQYGFWNIHPSLLPKYRGPSPVVYPLILGDSITGVSLIKMDNQLDHGPIISQERLKINPKETHSQLIKRLTNLAFKILKKQVSTDYKLTPQNNSLATYTRLLKKDDGFIPLAILKKALANEPLNFKDLPKIIKEYFVKTKYIKSKIYPSAKYVFNFFRGLFPWPGIWTKLDIKGKKKRLKLINLDLDNNQLIIKTVQLEGKKTVDFKTFNKHYKIF